MDDHYLAKINRNESAVYGAPEAMQPEIMQHIRWCKELASRLDQLDYDVRNTTIMKMHQVLDEDYQKMGYQLPTKGEDEDKYGRSPRF